MIKPNNPSNLQKTNAVVRELKTTLNRRRNNLQKGETSFEAIGQITQRNVNANKRYMNTLRRGSNTAAQSPVLTYKPPPTFQPYVKVAGLTAGVKSLSCKQADNGAFLCVPVLAGGKTRKRKALRR